MKIESGGIGVFKRGASIKSAALIAFCAASFGCGSVAENPQTAAAPAAASPIAAPVEQTSAPTTKRVPEKPPMSFPPRLEAALKKTIAARMNAWQASIEARDIEKHLQFYADRLDDYYLQQNVGREVVEADRAHAFAQFDRMKMQLINIDIKLQSTDEATVTFDKSWDFKKDAAFSNGLVQQEMRWRKIDKQWLIISEKDLQIYRYHNG